jgi:hypothetical protein
MSNESITDVHGHKNYTQWIHVIYRSSNHGHRKYTVDPCKNVDHSHKWIHSGAMSQNQIEDIWNQWSEQIDPLQVPMSKRVVQSIQVR